MYTKWVYNLKQIHCEVKYEEVRKTTLRFTPASREGNESLERPKNPLVS